MIGIIIGIAAVISIRMIGNAMSDAITEEMSQVGMSNIYLGLEPKEDEETDEFSDHGPHRGKIAEMTDEDYFTNDMLVDLKDHFSDEIEGISYSKLAVQGGKIVKGADYAVVDVTGINADFMKCKKKGITFQKGFVAGSVLSERAINEGRSETIISSKVCDNLFPKLSYDEIIGEEIQIPVGEETYSFHVKGIYQINPDFYEGLYDDCTDVYISYKFVENILHEKNIEQVEVIVNESVVKNADDFSDDVEGYMNKYYHNNENWSPSTYSLESYAKQATGMIKAVSIILISIAGIALFVGGIGVMNIMLVSVSERTREIGIRKSLGATNVAIQLQFVIESIVLSIIGGISGILTGRMLGGTAVTYMIPLMGTTATVSPRLDISSIIIAVGFSAAIGIFFGFYPATKAAKLNPIDALRD